MPTTKTDEIFLMNRIMDRAFELNVGYTHGKNARLTMFMDLENANQHIPLDFEKLLAFDNFNFAHDICGIQAHMNRATGKIEDCFLPRCAKPSKEEQDD